MSTQYAQPFSIDARSFTNSSTVWSTLARTYFSSPQDALERLRRHLGQFIRS